MSKSKLHIFTTKELRDIARDYNLHVKIPRYSIAKKSELIYELDKHLEITDLGKIRIFNKPEKMAISKEAMRKVKHPELGEALRHPRKKMLKLKNAKPRVYEKNTPFAKMLNEIDEEDKPKAKPKTPFSKMLDEIDEEDEEEEKPQPKPQEKSNKKTSFDELFENEPEQPITLNELKAKQPRGRPKKEPSQNVEPKEKKPRGRPKKEESEKKPKKLKMLNKEGRVERLKEITERLKNKPERPVDINMDYDKLPPATSELHQAERAKQKARQDLVKKEAEKAKEIETDPNYLKLKRFIDVGYGDWIQTRMAYNKLDERLKKKALPMYMQLAKKKADAIVKELLNSYNNRAYNQIAKFRENKWQLKDIIEDIETLTFNNTSDIDELVELSQKAQKFIFDFGREHLQNDE
jgi:hypothetical protein